MTIGTEFRFPDDRWQQRRKAGKLAWLSVCLLCTAAIPLFLALGQSQAMKTAWVSDVLTAVPPAALLVALRLELRPASERYPYGRYRSISIAFLVTAGMLTLIGLFLFVDSAMKLVKQERPPIGTMELMGHQFWAGWAMIAALSYSLLCGCLLGMLKKPVAARLHDKELHAEARMNRDEWLSEGAAIVGILLVGFGFWWGDAVAAAFISVEIIGDGWQSLRQVIGDLMDEAPSKMGKHELEDLPAKVKRAAEELDWVRSAGVRLREVGHVITGDVLVVPGEDGGLSAHDLAARVEDAARSLCDVDWRLHGLTVMPVTALESETPPRIRRRA